MRASENTVLVSGGTMSIGWVHSVKPSYQPNKAALLSHTQSTRYPLKGSPDEVLERAPPAVQTDLKPRSAIDPQRLPLADFVARTIVVLQRHPTAPKVPVECAKSLLNAERDGRLDAGFGRLNGGH